MKQWSPGLVASLASLAWRMQEPKAFTNVAETWQCCRKVLMFIFLPEVSLFFGPKSSSSQFSTSVAEVIFRSLARRSWQRKSVWKTHQKPIKNPWKTHRKPIKNHGKPFKNPWFGFQPLVDTQSNFRSLRSPKSLARVLLSSVDA